MKLVQITGNAYKHAVAKKALADLDIELTMNDMDTPEIQSVKVEEVAEYSAIWAAKKVGSPIFLSDVSYEIPALGGFPGPFIKFINGWLTAEQILSMMKYECDRTIIIKDCLAYATPDGNVKTFTNEFPGQLAMTAGKKLGTEINRICIPDGYNRVESEISKDEMQEYYAKSTNFKNLVSFLS